MKKKEINALIKDFVDKSKKLNVAIIGETIIDEFIDVMYEGRSMKSNCSVLSLKNKVQRQVGGAVVIARHLKDFVNSINLITNNNNEIVKTRYIDYFNGNKYIEINKFETENFKEIEIDTKDYDVVIVADFGHKFCDKLSINDGFHLMCQTNSNNFGFNRISKWKNFHKKSVTIDKREGALQCNKKINFENKNDIINLFNYEMNAESLFVTIGEDGSILTDGKKVFNQSCFKTNIVDTIGAGDTFFSFACLANTIYGNHSQVMLIPSLAAALSTTWLCNDKNVTVKRLIEFNNKRITNEN